MLRFILVFIGFLLFSNSPLRAQNKKKTPNVVIVFTDDQGYGDVGVFGAKDIATPNLDKMAKEGLTLTNFYAAQAVCSASRAGLLTGCYPNRIGVHQALMPNSKIGLNPKETTIADMLKKQGYATAIFGKWHLGDHPSLMPNQHGFDTYFGIPYSNDMWPLHPQQGPVFDFDPLYLYQNNKVIDTLTDQSQLTTQITERAVSFIKKNKKKPFFLYVAHPQPHVPLYVSNKFKGKSNRGKYGDVIMEIDWSVGEILKSLKKEGIDDNTIVIFTSDNGPWLAYGNHAGSSGPFREGKGTAFEGGQREPCIIRYPNKLAAGKIINSPLMAIDILPTLAHLTNAELPKNVIDGKNAWPLLSGKTDKSPQEAYFFYYKVNELHGVRYGDWKMYFPHNYRTMKGGKAGKDGLPGSYNFVDLEKVELYNLALDINESHDVAAQNPEVVKTINKLANEMRHTLGDALTNTKGTQNRAPGRVK